ncbi:DUF2306 domain-containing protein [Parvularcula marina]|uniref:DUF2306 domain-containing protein n=1 Tax=Parvularcula marina TaxID=2292771 RepID=A0A371RJK4_9PROT|nr:DUF2306 domain-containing protein [Parvularcula marina]RFB05632.1 DUF2306 domain-containing protein [Parvularcula marina]
MQPPRHQLSARLPGKALKTSGVIWYLTAAAGQLAFIYYILVYYGGRTARGEYAAWNDRPIIMGYAEGDLLGNIMFALHVLLAAVITFGGLMQLIPPLRRRFPALHRWNGRLFMALAVFMAIGGIWLVWGRGAFLSVSSGIPTTINGILILIFAGIALRYAIRRQIDQHRQWAMRLFMAVNGVWFFRVMIMAWIIGNQGPRGMNSTLSGPADFAISYGSFLLPLLGLEIYFAATRSQSAGAKLAAAGFVLLMSALMALGIFGTITRMWGPYL